MNWEFEKKKWSYDKHLLKDVKKGGKVLTSRNWVKLSTVFAFDEKSTKAIERLEASF